LELGAQQAGCIDKCRRFDQRPHWLIYRGISG
jgi:hypothetical protein